MNDSVLILERGFHGFQQPHRPFSSRAIQEGSSLLRGLSWLASIGLLTQEPGSGSATAVVVVGSYSADIETGKEGEKT